MNNSTKMIAGVLTLITLVATHAPTSIAQELPVTLGNFDFPGNSMVLEMTQPGVHPRVVVDLGDGEKYKFIVDTGASVNLMDSAIAERLGFEVIGKTETGAPGGPQVAMNIVRVPGASLGVGKITDAEFLLMDINGFSNGSMQGVLSMGLFREYLLTFDLGQGKVTVSRESLSSADPDVLSYDGFDGHIQIDVDVAGTVINSHIDTGAMGEFMLPGEVLTSLPILGEPIRGQKARLVGGEREITRAQIDGAIRFAGFEFNKPTVSFITPSTGYGNIGGEILSQLIMPIDQRNHLIGFRKPSIPVSQVAGKPRRLGVQFQGMGGIGELAIAMVEPGSLGASAGFIPGDKLLSVNDRLISDYDIQALGALIKGSEPLSFVVDRDGTQKIIEVQ